MQLDRPGNAQHTSLAVVFHGRLTRPLIGITLVLLGLSVILRDQNRNVFVSAGLCLILCAVFFAAADIVYWHFSHDPTGATALALAVGFAFLAGFYILFTGRRLPLRPEDNPDKSAKP